MGLAVILAIVGAVLGYWPWWIILCVVGAYIAFAMALGRHYAYKAIRSDIALAERRAGENRMPNRFQIAPSFNGK